MSGRNNVLLFAHLEEQIERVQPKPASLHAVYFGIVIFCSMTAICAGAHAQMRPDVPVVIEGGWQYDPCSNGVVAGLDPDGDGWLAVKSGPGLDYKRTDKLYNGAQIYLCGETKQWYAIVYPPRGWTAECNVTKPWPVSLPYTGPCRSGWVHKRYVKGVAG